MIGPGMLDCRSSLLRVSSLQSPVLPSKKKLACVPRRSYSAVVCVTNGSRGSGQSGFAVFRKQSRVQCGRPNKNGRWRVVAQCEADGAGQGFETAAAEESSSENGIAKSPSIASEVENRVADAGQSSGQTL